MIVEGKDKISTEKGRKPVAGEAVCYYSWSWNLGVTLNSCCSLDPWKHIHKEVELENDPSCKRNVAHEIVEKSQPV